MRMIAAALAALAIGAAPAWAVPEPPKHWERPPLEQVPNHRDLMRQVVIELASYAKKRKPTFIVLMREGEELVVKGTREAEWEEIQDPDGRNFEKRLPEGSAIRPLIKVLDGMVVDGLYCGPFAFGAPLAKAVAERKALDQDLARERKLGIHRPPVPVPLGPFSLDPKEELRKAAEIRQQSITQDRQRRMVYGIDAMMAEGRRILSLEGCKTQAAADAAAKDADRDRVLPFIEIAEDGTPDLNTVPRQHPRYENAATVATVATARNWLPVLNPSRFGTKDEWIQAMEAVNYDMLVVDVAFRGQAGLTAADVYRLKYKKLGSPRLVLANLPLGRAHDSRWYWKREWEAGSPPFLFAPDLDEPGAFLTDPADPEWRKLLGKTLAGIVDAGFDGVMFDEVATYRWFEELMPLRD